MEWYEQYFGKGTRKLTVYRDRKYRMFLVPDENIQLPPNHNCDAMGCGSVGPHIIGVYLPATKYDALKASHDKLKEAVREIIQRWGDGDASLGDVAMELEQAIAEAQKL